MKSRTTWTIWALLLLAALPSSAQLKVGENVNMNLNGQASFGYTGDYGNQIVNDHGLTAGGAATLTGSYYDPNFFSFTLNPFYGQSRLNSSYASDTLASGVSGTASIFSGSPFPGTVSFSKVYNSEGNFGIPGVANYTTHGDSDALGVGWGVNLPAFPNVFVNYQQGSNDSSLFGEPGNSQNAFHALNVHSTYQVVGFQVNGNYQHSNTRSEFPLLNEDGESESSESSGNSFSLGVGHKLPMRGSFSTNFNRTDFSSEAGTSGSSGETNYSGAVDTFSGNLNFNPIDRLSLGANTTYTDNLLGSLLQSVIAAGALVLNNTPNETSHSLDVTGFATYFLTKHWNVYASGEYRDQNSLGGLVQAGTEITSQVFTGTTSYTSDFKGGVVSALIGVQQVNVSAAGGTSNRVGLISSGNYSRDMGNWSFAGSGNYSQNSQTAVLGYTTSNLGYGGNILYRFEHLRWGATASGNKSVLDSTGYSTLAQNYSTSLAGRWFGVNATYNKNSGNALLAGTGYVPTPIPPVALPSQILFYGGTGWGVGLGANPTGRLSISANYSQSRSDTGGASTAYSFNTNQSINARVQYQVRQLYVNAGYSKLRQGFSASGTPPAMLASYYFGIQRWFNFF